MKSRYILIFSVSKSSDSISSPFNALLSCGVALQTVAKYPHTISFTSICNHFPSNQYSLTICVSSPLLRHAPSPNSSQFRFLSKSKNHLCPTVPSFSLPHYLPFWREGRVSPSQFSAVCVSCLSKPSATCPPQLFYFFSPRVFWPRTFRFVPFGPQVSDFSVTSPYLLSLLLSFICIMFGITNRGFQFIRFSYHFNQKITAIG